MNHKIASYIGFAIKAKKVVWGITQIKNSRKTPYIIICADDLGRSNAKVVDNYLTGRNVIKLSMPAADITDATHKKNCRVFAVTDESLAKAIYDNCKRMEVVTSEQ